MDIEKTATRPHGQGVLDAVLAAAPVPDSSATAVVLRRRSVLDSSRYDISETRVGEMVLQIYQQPLIRGATRRDWYCDIYWRGQRLWSESMSESLTTRCQVEAAAVRTADRLAWAVRAVGRVLTAESEAAGRSYKDQIPPTWTMLPDEVEEPQV